MGNIKRFQIIVNENLEKEKLGQHPTNLYDPVKYVLEIGGKRIRAVLCLIACEIFSDDYLNALKASLGLEIFHNFTLLHDDMMDVASVRRGFPTVHEKWNTNIALLSGDAMSIIAYKYIAQTPINLKECLDVFSDTALKICEGQQLDMDFENIDSVCIEDYLNMIGLKTAVFLACSLKIGAIIGGASSKDADLMYEVGMNIGLAFQLQDDLLDVFGEESKFGKQIGGDIIANKKTFLLISALQKANPDTFNEITNWINRTTFVNEDKISKFKNIYEDLNIKEFTKEHIDKYLQLASQNLKKVSCNESKKDSIYDFIDTIHNRNH